MINYLHDLMTGKTKKETLTFIGDGGAFDDSNSSAYVIIGDTMLLIDIGESNVKKTIDIIKDSNILNLRIVVTHNHFDHIGGLSTVLHFVNIFYPSIKVTITSPSTESTLRLLTIGGNKGINVELHQIDNLTLGDDVVAGKGKHRFPKETECFDVDLDTGVRDICARRKVFISYFESKHVSNMPSYSIMLSIPKGMSSRETILFSGDCRMLNPNINLNQIDVYYQDVSYVNVDNDVELPINFPHMTITSFMSRMTYFQRVNAYTYHNSRGLRKFITMERLFLDFYKHSFLPAQNNEEIIGRFFDGMSKEDRVRFNIDGCVANLVSVTENDNGDIIAIYRISRNSLLVGMHAECGSRVGKENRFYSIILTNLIMSSKQCIPADTLLGDRKSDTGNKRAIFTHSEFEYLDLGDMLYFINRSYK